MTARSVTDGLASSLWRVRSDVGRHTTSSLPPETLDHYRNIAAIGSRAWFESVETLYEHVNAIIRNPKHASHPVRRLTYQALQASAQYAAGRLKVVNIHDEETEMPCLKAEPRALESLRSHMDGTDAAGDRRPGVVMSDVDGERFAYRKPRGQRIAYAWRAGLLATQDGVRYIPGDSFFHVEYPRDEDPMLRYLGAGLICLDNYRQPDDAYLLRYSTATLPCALASDATQLALLEDTGRPYVREPYVLDFDRDEIARQVHTLLQAGAAISV